MQVIFSKIELEISPFLTVIKFYSNIVEKRVGKSPQEISTRPTFRNILSNLKGTRQYQNGIAPRCDKYIGLYLPDYALPGNPAAIQVVVMAYYHLAKTVFSKFEQLRAPTFSAAIGFPTYCYLQPHRLTQFNVLGDIYFKVNNDHRAETLPLPL